MPGYAAETEVGKRMAERGQLPVEDRHHLRPGRMEKHVAEAEIAVGNGETPIVLGLVVLHPCSDAVECGNALGWGFMILPRPPRDLAREIVARLAIVGKADRFGPDGMEPCQ